MIRLRPAEAGHPSSLFELRRDTSGFIITTPRQVAAAGRWWMTDGSKVEDACVLFVTKSPDFKLYPWTLVLDQGLPCILYTKAVGGPVRFFAPFLCGGWGNQWQGFGCVCHFRFWSPSCHHLFCRSCLISPHCR